MVKPVVIVKIQRGQQGASARSLRRAIRPSRVTVGPRVAIFLIAFTLVLGWIGISFNRNLEKREHEHLLSIGRQEK
jgi:hypothetical protein